VEDRSRRRARLVLIAGVLLAAIAGVFTFFYAQTTKSEAPAPIPTTAVIVAAREIPPKTQITSADLKLVRINSDAVPPAAVSDPAQVVGKITITTISVGEPVLPSKLAGPNGAAFVVIPPDALGANGAIQANTPQYRAMSITVSDALAAGGNIQPGDTVDLLYTLNLDPVKYLTNASPTKNTTDVSARIVIERMPILARNLSVYVIRTDAAMAERIAYLMAAGGQMQMVLRAPKDDRATGTTGQSFDTVTQEFKFHIPTKISG
jgi:Flp pilus assembly protein CpaB